MCETQATVGGPDSAVVCLYTPAIVQELEACFAPECAAIASCVEAFFSRYGFAV